MGKGRAVKKKGESEELWRCWKGEAVKIGREKLWRGKGVGKSCEEERGKRGAVKMLEGKSCEEDGKREELWRG
jgi:hypothetical protein